MPQAVARAEPVTPLIRALLDTTRAGQATAAHPVLLAGTEVRQLYAPEIGRASCRERVLNLV